MTEEEMTLEEYNQMREDLKNKRKPSNKYRAIKTEVDGIKFDSKKEARRYQELKILERAGEIRDLVVQPEYLLQEGFTYNGKKERAIHYVADFQYIDTETNQLIIEDVKGMRNKVYLLKRKLFLYKCNQGIRLTGGAVDTLSYPEFMEE